jgi:hypothetical protein
MGGYGSFLESFIKNESIQINEIYLKL